MTQQHTAVVLGGYVNAYGIVRSLHEAGVRQIVVLDTFRSPASFSQFVAERIILDSLDALPAALEDLAVRAGRLVVFPTSDEHVEHLARHHDRLSAACFLPLNPATTLAAGEKSVQYAAAERAGVSVPKTRLLRNLDEVSLLDELMFPVLLKPSRRIDAQGVGFRNRLLSSREAISPAVLSDIHEILAADVDLLASEVIPGDDNVYAYTAYRSSTGRILRSWTGRKLSQHPDAFGVYASATAVIDRQLERDGRAVVEALDCYGICEPEFKFDPRDGRYKLMEVNLRSMMWHRTGTLVDVNLPEAQWLDATGNRVPDKPQSSELVVHYYWAHEFANLIGRRGYLATYRANLRFGRRREGAFWNPRDPLPFLASLRYFPRLVVIACLRRFAHG